MKTYIPYYIGDRYSFTLIIFLDAAAQKVPGQRRDGGRGSVPMRILLCIPKLFHPPHFCLFLFLTPFSYLSSLSTLPNSSPNLTLFYPQTYHTKLYFHSSHHFSKCLVRRIFQLKSCTTGSNQKQIFAVLYE
jgi:hypothetical protein